MKFTKIALAVVATAAIAGQAQAATTFLSGASATSINYSSPMLIIAQRSCRT